MKNLALTFLAFVLITMLFTACTKENNVTPTSSVSKSISATEQVVLDDSCGGCATGDGSVPPRPKKP